MEKYLKEIAEELKLIRLELERKEIHVQIETKSSSVDVKKISEALAQEYATIERYNPNHSSLASRLRN